MEVVLPEDGAQRPVLAGDLHDPRFVDGIDRERHPFMKTRLASSQCGCVPSIEVLHCTGGVVFLCPGRDRSLDGLRKGSDADRQRRLLSIEVRLGYVNQRIVVCRIHSRSIKGARVAPSAGKAVGASPSMLTASTEEASDRDRNRQRNKVKPKEESVQRVRSPAVKPGLTCVYHFRETFVTCPNVQVCRSS